VAAIPSVTTGQQAGGPSTNLGAGVKRQISCPWRQSIQIPVPSNLQSSAMSTELTRDEMTSRFNSEMFGFPLAA
jgi:hypothetical protein